MAVLNFPGTVWMEKHSIVWTGLTCVAGEIRERASERWSRHIPREGNFNSTLHQSSHGLATRVHGFFTKTEALAREIPPAAQARTGPEQFRTKTSFDLRKSQHGNVKTLQALYCEFSAKHCE